MVAVLEEDLESNYLRKHVLRDQQHWLAKGMSGKRSFADRRPFVFSVRLQGVMEPVLQSWWNQRLEQCG